MNELKYIFHVALILISSDLICINVLSISTWLGLICDENFCLQVKSCWEAFCYFCLFSALAGNRFSFFSKKIAIITTTDMYVKNDRHINTTVYST